MKKSNVVISIEKMAPDLEVQEIKFLSSGASYDVYEVNKNWIFRFAQNSDASLKLQREIKLLPFIENSLPVQIPQFTYQGIQHNGNLAVGHKKIIGQIFTPTVLKNLSTQHQKIIIKSLAEFLKALHAFPLRKALSCGIEIYDLQQACEYDLESSAAFSSYLQKQHLYAYITAFLADFIENDENSSYRPALVHADISSNHLFLNPKTYELKAVIDWGEVQIADPDFDLAFYTYPTFGKEFMIRLISYLHPSSNSRAITKLLQKLRNLHILRLVQHLLFALKNKNRVLIDYHANELKAAVKEN